MKKKIILMKCEDDLQRITISKGRAVWKMQLHYVSPFDGKWVILQSSSRATYEEIEKIANDIAANLTKRGYKETEK